MDTGSDKPRIFGVLVAFALSAITSVALGAPPDHPLSLRVSNGAYDTWKFVLDGKVSCEPEEGKDCIFSTDCTKFPNLLCVKAAIKAGKHLIGVRDERGYVRRQWVDIEPEKNDDKWPANIPECQLSESMGRPIMYLDCS